jgi:hypothetical protein
MKSLLKKFMKAHYKCDDFGRGKSPTAKKRHRRTIKKKSLREFFKSLMC